MKFALYRSFSRLSVRQPELSKVIVDGIRVMCLGEGGSGLCCLRFVPGQIVIFGGALVCMYRCLRIWEDMQIPCDLLKPRGLNGLV